MYIVPVLLSQPKLYGLVAHTPWRACLTHLLDWRVNIKALSKWAKKRTKQLTHTLPGVYAGAAQAKKGMIYGYLGYEATHHRCCIYYEYICWQLTSAAAEACSSSSGIGVKSVFLVMLTYTYTPVRATNMVTAAAVAEPKCNSRLYNLLHCVRTRRLCEYGVQKLCAQLCAHFASVFQFLLFCLLVCFVSVTTICYKWQQVASSMSLERDCQQSAARERAFSKHLHAHTDTLNYIH